MLHKNANNLSLKTGFTYLTYIFYNKYLSALKFNVNRNYKSKINKMSIINKNNKTIWK